VIVGLTPSSEWAPPPQVPTLETGNAAVWLFDADTIQPIEEVLARYLGAKPSAVVLRRSAAGKPELPGSALRASLANSGEVALVAVASGREVGVDVEPLRPGTESWSLTSHALTQGERARLETLPASRRSEAFLSMWTRKEALLKAVGVGLVLDPQLIELDGQRVISVPPELNRVHDWTLVDVPLSGYAAALALRGRLSRLLLYDTRPCNGSLEGFLTRSPAQDEPSEVSGTSVRCPPPSSARSA
jgi:phosphopantetheine--protein transferase-like protein